MKQISVCLMILLSSQSFSQEIPVEIMFGHHHYRYQHSVSRTFKEYRWGFAHVSSVIKEYGKDSPAELMSQSYLTYKINKNIQLGAGTFYGSVPGFTPSVNLQFSKASNNYLIVIVPRIDVKTDPSYELMFFTEYFPHINEHLQLYTRIQVMENFTGSSHNRSYQYFRIGLKKGNIRYGIGFDLDAYGKNTAYTQNVGVFAKIHV